MTIRCYKSYTPVQAIGFDLDDTLYDNAPILERAERKLRQHLLLHFPKTQRFDQQHWLSIRQQAIAQQPNLINDTSELRLATLRLGLSQLEYQEQEANVGAEIALEKFIRWRNEISIDDEIHKTLSALKQRFRLFVISNGNADIDKIGLAHYFEFALHPSQQQPMKPAPVLFQLAQQRLNLAPQKILYVGDHPISDIKGANDAGWKSAWLNISRQRFAHQRKPLQLPSIELESITELTALSSRVC